MRTLLIIVLFFLLGGFLIVSNQQLHLIKSEDALSFSRQYYSWILGVFDSIGGITGAVVNAEWLPDTISSSNNTAP